MREKLRPVLEKRFHDKGFVVLFWGDVGWVRFFSKEPAAAPAGLPQDEAVRLGRRQPAGRLHESPGLPAVLLEVTDILPGLQTGLIDVRCRAPFYALAGQFFRRRQHMLDMKWAPLVGAVGDHAQGLGRAVAGRCRKRCAGPRCRRVELRASSRRENDEAIEAMKKRGLIVHAITPEIEAEWRAWPSTIYPLIRGLDVPAELFDEVQRLLRECRAAPRSAPRCGAALPRAENALVAALASWRSCRSPRWSCARRSASASRRRPITQHLALVVGMVGGAVAARERRAALALDGRGVPRRPRALRRASSAAPSRAIAAWLAWRRQFVLAERAAGACSRGASRCGSCKLSCRSASPSSRCASRGRRPTLGGAGRAFALAAARRWLRARRPSNVAARDRDPGRAGDAPRRADLRDAGRRGTPPVLGRRRADRVDPDRSLPAGHEPDVGVDPALHAGRLLPRRGRRVEAPGSRLPGLVQRVSRRSSARDGARVRVLHDVHGARRASPSWRSADCSCRCSARGLPRANALGLVTGAGSLGACSRPACRSILYAIVAKVPMRDMFLAGILPGSDRALLAAAWGRRHRAARRRRAPSTCAMPGAPRWSREVGAAAAGRRDRALFGGFATPVEAAAHHRAVRLCRPPAFVHRDLPSRATSRGARRVRPRHRRRAAHPGGRAGLHELPGRAPIPDRAVEWAPPRGVARRLPRRAQRLPAARRAA